MPNYAWIVRKCHKDGWFGLPTIPHSIGLLQKFHSIWRPQGRTSKRQRQEALRQQAIEEAAAYWHDMRVCTNERKGNTLRRDQTPFRLLLLSVAPSFKDVFFLNILTCLFSPWTLCWMQEERRKREEAGAYEFWLLPSFAHIISVSRRTGRKKEKLPKRRRRKPRRFSEFHWVQLREMLVKSWVHKVFLSAYFP